MIYLVKCIVFLFTLGYYYILIPALGDTRVVIHCPEH